jgi:hypothetical protein
MARDEQVWRPARKLADLKGGGDTKRSESIEIIS